jgi:hypothetical protein
MAMLSAAGEAYCHAQTQLRFSCIMCVDVAGVQLMEAAAARCKDSTALFPEHRYNDDPNTTLLSRWQCILVIAHLPAGPTGYWHYAGTSPVHPTDTQASTAVLACAVLCCAAL